MPTAVRSLKGIRTAVSSIPNNFTKLRTTCFLRRISIFISYWDYKIGGECIGFPCFSWKQPFRSLEPSQKRDFVFQFRKRELRNSSYLPNNSSIDHVRTGTSDPGVMSSSLISPIIKAKSADSGTFSHTMGFIELRGLDSNQRPPGYEPDELPLLYPATGRTNSHYITPTGASQG